MLTFRQGSRTPHTDPLARGAFVGLTLSHTRAHMFRAILESVCYGTRSCFEALEGEDLDDHAESKATEVVIAGGATRSDLWLQLHADITGRTFLLNENTDGPLLGCAILASVGSGIYSSVDEAAQHMIRRERRIESRPEVKEVYDRLYKEVYLKVRPGVTDVFHTVAKLRGGGDFLSDDDIEVVGKHHYGDKMNKSTQRCGIWGMRCGSIRGGSMDNEQLSISPSLLASDW